MGLRQCAYPVSTEPLRGDTACADDIEGALTNSESPKRLP